MSEEAKDLPRNGILKSIGERQGHDHDRHADDGGGYRQTDNETGKSPLRIENDTRCYEGGNIQVADFVLQK